MRALFPDWRDFENESTSGIPVHRRSKSRTGRRTARAQLEARYAPRGRLGGGSTYFPTMQPERSAGSRGEAGMVRIAEVAPGGPERSRIDRSALIATAKYGALVAVAAGFVGWALTSGESPFVYSVMVGEVVANRASYEGRVLRVEGPLQDGSIQFRDEPCEYRFVLAEGERVMNVRFPQCIVPDTFREGMGISVVVEGRLEPDGTFLASQVIPRCPSRYEMDELQRRGEVAPHPVPAS